MGDMLENDEALMIGIGGEIDKHLKGFTFLVTGGTGFLGVHVIKLLLSGGAKVRVFARSNDPELEEFVGQKVPIHHGSIGDIQSLQEASQGVDGIFHLAGLVAHTRKREAADAMHETNVIGTINVMKVAAKIKCRVVYISTSGVVGCSNDKSHVADDNSNYCTKIVKDWPYYSTKIEAELRAKEIADKEGVELVILRPSAMLGPGDARFRSTHTTLSFIDKRIPFVPSGIISFVDVRDVAQCSIVGMVKENKALNWSTLAPISPSSSSNLSSSTITSSSSSSSSSSTTSPVGKSFLLGSANWTMFEFFDAIERCSGVQKPKLRGIPTSVIKPLLNIFNNIKAKTKKKKEEGENSFGSEEGEEDRLSKPNPHNLPRPGCAETQTHLHRWYTGAEAPLIEIQRRREKEESSSSSWDPVKLEMSGCNWSIRSTKAGPFLGFSPRDPLLSISDTVRWIFDNRDRLGHSRLYGAHKRIYAPAVPSSSAASPSSSSSRGLTPSGASSASASASVTMSGDTKLMAKL